MSVRSNKVKYVIRNDMVDQYVEQSHKGISLEMWEGAVSINERSEYVYIFFVFILLQARMLG